MSLHHPCSGLRTLYEAPNGESTNATILGSGHTKMTDFALFSIANSRVLEQVKVNQSGNQKTGESCVASCLLQFLGEQPFDESLGNA